MTLMASHRVAILTATAFIAAGTLIPARADEQPPLKIGLILPYKGVWAAPVENIDRGFRVAIAEFDGKAA
jgi:branched-chain amino acid transport system substrate-binding protein